MLGLEQEFLYIDSLAISVGVCITFFTVLTLLYSWGYVPRGKGRILYDVYILLTLATALGAVLTSNLIIFLMCWGVTGILLYVLIGYGTKERTPSTAKKAFIIIGGTDAFMMLGVVLIGQLSGTFFIQDIQLTLQEPQAVFAFLCLLLGILAKVGAIPLHSLARGYRGGCSHPRHRLFTCLSGQALRDLSFGSDGIGSVCYDPSDVYGTADHWGRDHCWCRHDDVDPKRF